MICLTDLIPLLGKPVEVTYTPVMHNDGRRITRKLYGVLWCGYGGWLNVVFHTVELPRQEAGMYGAGSHIQVKVSDVIEIRGLDAA